MKLARGRQRTIAILFCCFIVFGATILLFTERSYADDADAAVPSDIIISEVYPNPDPESCDELWCKNEWIELANSSNEDIALTGYTIEDLNIYNKIGSPDDYRPDKLDSYTIPAQGLLLLVKEKKDFSFTINNENEKIFLRKNKIVVSLCEYGDSEGESYAFFGADGWKWTTTPTPGDKNILTGELPITESPSNEPIDISLARGESNGTIVTIAGTVTAVPNTLSSQYFYIQDETGGLQIYSYYKNFPTLDAGDTIQASGELSEISGERRLKISSENDIKIITRGEPPPPKPVEIIGIGENLEGQYVKTSGTVAETSGDTFVLQDKGNHQIKVVIKSMTNIEKPKMKKGDLVEVTGIVSQYKSEYRILPIDQDDVKIINSNHSILPETGFNILLYPFISFALMLLWNTFQKARTKQRA